MALPEIIKDLLENGVHFGHLSKHWNPKMQRFIHGKKKNVYIIDLEKTVTKIDEAKDFLRKVVEDNGKVLFVSTKRQARDVIKEAACNCGMPYVVDRWIGGLLTNFPTIKERLKDYLALKEKRDGGGFDGFTKKETVLMNKKLDKMEHNYAGVASLEEPPACLFVVDPKKELTAIREANKLSIPVVALIDTDGDPEVIDYPIPGNDDAMKSIRYITSCMAEVIIEAMERTLRSQQAEEEEKVEEVAVAVETEDSADDISKKKSRKKSQPKEE